MTEEGHQTRLLRGGLRRAARHSVSRQVERRNAPRDEHYGSALSLGVHSKGDAKPFPSAHGTGQSQLEIHSARIASEILKGPHQARAVFGMEPYGRHDQRMLLTESRLTTSHSNRGSTDACSADRGVAYSYRRHEFTTEPGQPQRAGVVAGMGFIVAGFLPTTVPCNMKMSVMPMIGPRL